MKFRIEAAIREHLAMPAADRSGPQAVRVARAVAALREAHAILQTVEVDGQLSESRYETLRRDHPDRDWPPESSIRQWLAGGTGALSWVNAVTRAGLEAPKVHAAPRARLGGELTREECLDAVRGCAADHEGEPQSLSAYMVWAKLTEVSYRPGRRPLSQGPFDRLFGGYRPCMLASGLLGDNPDAPFSSGLEGQRPRGYRFTREQMGQALRTVAQIVGRSPRSAEYQSARGRLLDEAMAAGQPIGMPSYAVINRSFGSWDAALEAAGLLPLGRRSTKSHPRRVNGPTGPEKTREHMLSDVRVAMDRLGEDMTLAAYTRYRHEIATRDIPPCSTDTLRAWIAPSWEQIKQVARDARPAHEQHVADTLAHL